MARLENLQDRVAVRNMISHTSHVCNSHNRYLTTQRPARCVVTSRPRCIHVPHHTICYWTRLMPFCSSTRRPLLEPAGGRLIVRPEREHRDLVPTVSAQRPDDVHYP